MRKGVKIGAVVALVVALTSCSNSTDTTAPSTEPVGFANVETDTTPTPEPLVAEAPVTEEPATGTPEEQFAERVKFYLDIDPASNQVPNATAEQLLVAGHAACEKRAAGETINEFSVIEGETTINDLYWSSGQITIAALETICTDVPLNDEG